jgi:N-methylhydantoinase A
MGLLLTDPKTHFSGGRLMMLSPETLGDLARGFSGLEAQAEEWFNQEGIAASDRTINRSLDMRYAGQGHELVVRCPAGDLDLAAMDLIRARFEEVHNQVYGFIATAEAMQVVTLRVEAVGRAPKASIGQYAATGRSADQAVMVRRDVWLPEAGRFVSCPVYDRERLGPGHRIAGPAVIEQMDSTTLVLPDQTATVDPWLNLLIEDAA